MYTCPDDLDADALLAGFRETFRFVDQSEPVIQLQSTTQFDERISKRLVAE